MKELVATGGTHVPSRSSDSRLHASSSSLDLAPTDNEQVLWVKCRGCEELVFKKMLVRNLYTCPRCQYNNPMPNDQRIRQTLDSVEYMSTDDPDFSQIGPTKLLEYHQAVVGLGQIGNGNVVILAGIPTNLTLPLRAIELAIDQQAPLITFIPSDYNPTEAPSSQSLDMSQPRLEGVSAHTSTLNATFRIICTKGTYIRSLVSDIGKDLACGAALSGLTRTSSGVFHLQDAYTIEQIKQNPSIASDAIIPLEQARQVLDHYRGQLYSDKGPKA